VITKAELRSEIVKCGRDPQYFINKYVRIQHPKRGLIPFKTFSYQDELIEKYQKHRFNIILKARQMGISEVTAAYAVWLMLFHRDKNILVMASKADTAKNIIRKVKTALKKIPSWLVLADINTDNKLSVELSNGSQIKAIATSEDAGRSEALSLLIIDEAAFVPRFGELWTGLYPTVAAGGNVIILSTPNGVGNKFHELYVEAERGENEFCPSKLMWWLHPERVSDLKDDPDRPGFKTSSWYRKEIKSANMGQREVAQELECNFNASGETVIPTDGIEWIKSGVIDPQTYEHNDRSLWVWWTPEVHKKYFITADVSRGDGKDYSSFIVWDMNNMEEVAEYYGKVPVEEHAKLIMETGKLYNNALLVVENTAIGLACLEHIRLAGYPNVYYSRKGDHKPGEAVNAAWGPNTDDLVIGFTTSPKNRPLIISKFEEYIRNKAMIFRSKRVVEELRTFIWHNGRGQAAGGYNDDLVMAAAIGAWIRDTYLAPYAATSEVRKKLVENIGVQSTTNTQIPGATKDPRFVRQPTQQQFVNKQRPYQYEIRPGQRMDLSWLLGR
jgi:hypothetical protein